MSTTTVVTVILVLLIALYVIGHVQCVRGKRALGPGWRVRTTLPTDELEPLIKQRLKGHNPLARVRRSLEEGDLHRKVLRWSYNLTNRATINVDAVPLDPSGSHSDVRAWIGDVEIEHALGMAHPFMSAPLAAKRRLMALNRALAEADPKLQSVPFEDTDELAAATTTAGEA